MLRKMGTDDYSGLFIPSIFENHNYNILPVNDRVCTENVVEDEFHFVMHCQLYNSLRITLFVKAQRVIDNFSSLDVNEKFIRLFQMCHRNLSIFISGAPDSINISFL